MKPITINDEIKAVEYVIASYTYSWVGRDKKTLYCTAEDRRNLAAMKATLKRLHRIKNDFEKQ